MRGAYQTYSTDVKSAIVKSQNPCLFPELSIPESTVRYWLRHSKKIHGSQKAHRETVAWELIVSDLQLVLSALSESKVNIEVLTAEQISRLRIALKRKTVTKYLPRRTVNLLQDKVFHCPVSVDGICIRRHPSRIEQGQLRKMQEYFESATFGHMPTCSVAIRARRDGAVMATPSSWYKYAKKMGWKRPFQRKPKIKSHGKGIKANKPHQVWHVDVTEIAASDGVKLFLAVVLDNFSRFVLSWRLEPCKSQETSKVILEEALCKSGVRRGSVLELISDGGPENHIFKRLTDGVSVQHKIAGVEIKQPNTMIEAFFRSLKSDYLSRLELRDTDCVRDAVCFFIDQHNYEIPRKGLGGLTPNEVLAGVPAQSILTSIDISRRVEINRTICCPHCWIE